MRNDPSDFGFDPDRLARLGTHFRRYVDDGRLAACHVRLARHGEVVHDTLAPGSDPTAPAVTPESIWRIYSMSKPITSVAAMMLWEEGLFELRDPVSRFLPEYNDLKVWRSGSATSPVCDPVVEPMQMWHLMTHTAGLTYGFMQAHPVDALYRAAGFDFDMPKDVSLGELSVRLAELPLLFQPGAEWNYSMAIDVLGRVVEVLAGQRLDGFLNERILRPLGMVDTGFHISQEHAGRAVGLYAATPASPGKPRQAFRLAGAEAAAFEPPAACLGGGGLVSTMDDYCRFAEMLRRGGTAPDGTRLLAPGTVRYMASNHLPGGVDLSQYGRPLFSETTYDGVGFGLLGSVALDPVKAKVPGSVGEFGWGGAASTFFWVDPVLDLTCVFMTQLIPSSAFPIRSQLKQMVHQAFVA